MVGREITEIYPESKSKIGEVILKVKHASRKGEFKKIDFELRKGEKLGIAGLMGAGRTELMMAVFGAAKLEEGEIEIGEFLSEYKVRKMQQAKNSACDRR